MCCERAYTHVHALCSIVHTCAHSLLHCAFPAPLPSPLTPTLPYASLLPRSAASSAMRPIEAACEAASSALHSAPEALSSAAQSALLSAGAACNAARAGVWSALHPPPPLVTTAYSVLHTLALLASLILLCCTLPYALETVKKGRAQIYRLMDRFIFALLLVDQVLGFLTFCSYSTLAGDQPFLAGIRLTYIVVASATWML